MIRELGDEAGAEGLSDLAVFVFFAVDEVGACGSRVALVSDAPAGEEESAALLVLSAARALLSMPDPLVILALQQVF
ncbi:hypothetical protein UVI_02020230 [Ustilaginoidea virens]|uniref:Uncharacterized protein n=1 Tax=Ustilaginoidea virens TaxID=1159556 RepID=A0A1B5L3M5_USTVR|nr:hypothetical protein UVI_02020230 [Ustilaginoidea virens]